ncbi:hypothetical protein G5714_017979 [Onychostoma macrolepis]|uniref:Uncharacterized protein n=1 Tax=Onychostoma macrolepis TaxID=369639 RepID=A0A7J6C2N8_9TELE|nr:hypothetical protein G5714_017979 [Onychostoma macrolepis]
MSAIMGLMNVQEFGEGDICTGQSPLHAIIGDSESTATVILSRTTGPFKIPVISHSASCECLGNGGEMRLEVDPWRLCWEELEERMLWQENGLASGLDLRKKMDAGQGALEVTGVQDGKEELKREEGEG